MESYQIRMIVEYSQLNQRIQKLEKYLIKHGDETGEYIGYQRSQLVAMRKYRSCLEKRAALDKITL